MTLITTISAQPIALLCGDPTDSNTAGVGVANTAYLVATDRLPVPATLTGVRVRFGAGGAGHYDVGVRHCTTAGGGAGRATADRGARRESTAG